jgi:hypothetical protein
MARRIIGRTQDLRSSTHVVYTQMSVDEYLDLVGEKFDQFEIQRNRQEHKAYDRLKVDVSEGALLPSITLALKFHLVPAAIEALANFDASSGKAALEAIVFKKEAINILDGLQRTHILRDLRTEGISFKSNHEILAEIWIEPLLQNLIYRIIVLNAGHKPMSMRHQVELLFLTIREKIQEIIPGVELYRETDETRRRRPGKLALDRVVSAYHAFITRNPDISKENIVATTLMESDVTTQSEERMHEEFSKFIQYLRWYVELDQEICRIYRVREDNIPTGANWFGSENVMTGFFAAISDFSTDDKRRERTERALKNLLERLKKAKEADDVLALDEFQKVASGFNSRKVNVGRATRKLLQAGFKEFFREEGDKSLALCWIAEAE